MFGFLPTDLVRETKQGPILLRVIDAPTGRTGFIILPEGVVVDDRFNNSIVAMMSACTPNLYYLVPAILEANIRNSYVIQVRHRHHGRDYRGVLDIVAMILNQQEAANVA